MSNLANQRFNGRMEGNRIYVSNLDYSCTFQEVKELFQPYAEVAFVEIVKGPDSRPSGTAIVRFKDASVAKQVIEETYGKEFKGRKVIVREESGTAVIKLKIHLSNLPFTSSVEEIREFCSQVGEVGYVEILRDDRKRPTGNCLVRYKDTDSVNTAISELHGMDLQGRKINVREYNEEKSQNQPNFVNKGQGGKAQIPAFESQNLFSNSPFNNNSQMDMPSSVFNHMANVAASNPFTNPAATMGGLARNLPNIPSMGMSGMGPDMHDGMASSFRQRLVPNNKGPVWDGGDLEVNDRKRKMTSDFDKDKFGNTYGLSPEFLESLGIDGPIVNRIFVANLDYKVAEDDLRELFAIAGNVTDVELMKNDDGKSKGYGFIEFEHPLEAVQAISALNEQVYFERRVNVRLDRKHKKKKETPKLPPGLKSIGSGLAVDGGLLIIKDSIV